MEDVKPMKQKLYQLFIRTNPIVRTLWGYEEAELWLESETMKLVNRVIDVLVKEITTPALDELIWAIEHSNQLSECVIIPYLFNCDKRFTTLYRNVNLNVLICKVWRWPDITSGLELCSNPVLCSYSMLNSLVVCINPHHYVRIGEVMMPQETSLLQHPWLKNAILASMQPQLLINHDFITSNIFSASNYLEMARQRQDQMMTDRDTKSQPFLDFEWMSKPEEQVSAIRELPMVEMWEYKPAAKRQKIECGENAITEDTQDSSTLTDTPVTCDNLVTQPLLDRYEIITPSFSDFADIIQSRKRRRSETPSFNG